MHMRKRLWSLTAAGLVVGLVVAACGGDDGGGETISPGFEDCADDPNECNGAPRDALADGEGTITWGAEQAWTNWNINHTDGNLFTATSTLRRVLPQVGWWAPSGDWVWNLDLWAEEPQLTNEDPQTMTYQIRPEAKWSDGTDITADDAIFRWYGSSGDEELCDGCEPASSAYHSKWDSVDVADNGKTFTVTMKEGEFNPAWFTGPTDLMPWHLAEAAGYTLDDPASVAEAFNDFFVNTELEISGGPYTVSEFVSGEHTTLVPNPEWYGQWQPTLESIVIRIVDDQQALVQGIQGGEIDGAAPQPNPDMVQQAQATDGLMSNVGIGYQFEHLDFNIDKAEWQDVELRRAIFTAIDVPDINEVTFGSFAEGIEQKTNHVFKPDSEYFVDHISGTGQGTGDADAALDILETAGYELVDDQLMDPEGDPVGPLLFQHSAGNVLRQTTAELVQTYLAEIGIEVQIEAKELDDILTELEYDMVIFAWVGSPDFSVSGHQYWHSENPNNFGRYSNPEVDQLLEQAIVQPDLDGVAEYYNQAMELVVPDAYVLPIADKPEFLMVYDDYLNVRPNNTVSGSLYNADEWGIPSAE